MTSGVRTKQYGNEQSDQKITGLARALSKLGFCSRSDAWKLIRAGRVRVNRIVLRDGEKRIALGRDRIEVDGQHVREERKIYLMLNKPRGLITTVSDEKGRATVFDCLAQFGREASSISTRRPSSSKPRLFAVGRLDKASEGLLLFTNDTRWAAEITDPKTHLEKTYHVQIDQLANEALLDRLRTGVKDADDFLKVKHAAMLRCGEKNSWLKIVLDEGKNRHIRRLLAAFGLNVLRLVRVSVGPLQLGQLAKGQWRELNPQEVAALENL